MSQMQLTTIMKILPLFIYYLASTASTVATSDGPEGSEIIRGPTIWVEATTLRSITIGWWVEDPMVRDRIHHYKLMLKEGLGWDTMTVPKTVNSYKFENLQAESEYYFAVNFCLDSGCDDEHWGSGSARTMDRDPKFIPVIFVFASCPNSITIEWLTPPPDKRDLVHEYKVMLTDQNVTRELIYLPITAGIHVFRNLSENVEYGLNVAACSEYRTQCGNWSSEKKVVTTAVADFGITVSVIATTSDSITIGWSALSPNEVQFFTTYQVVLFRWDMMLGPLMLPLTLSSHTFQNLTAETSYHFRLRACVDEYRSCNSWSSDLEILTIDRELKFIPNVSIEATTLDSITIEWSMPPPELLDRVHQYKVMATRQDEIKVPIYLEKTEHSYTFENLTSDSDYQLKVAACSDFITICAEWSRETEGRTIDRDPEFVPTIHVEACTNDSITIGWTTPPPELQHRVHQYKAVVTHRDETRAPVYFDNTTNSHVFRNLTPRTSYKLKVAACSDYITQCGNWSSEKEVLTIEPGTTNNSPVEDGPDVLRPSLIVIVLLLVAMVIGMIIRKRRETARKKKLMAETIKNLNIEPMYCFDAKLDVGDQAERLPYNNKWEFPRELLKLDKILGSGAFGIVRKAQAKSICQPDNVTTVAVKMVLATAKPNYISALLRELKILCYLGQHLNVVNLLGACTKNLSYGELFVIVEYCRFGNLRDYLFRHRFDLDVDRAYADDTRRSTPSHIQNTNSDIPPSCAINASASDSDVQVEVSCSSTDSRDSSLAVEDCVSDNESQSVDHDMRSKYDGDYEDQNLKLITLEDLVCWAWQVTRGMKYLGFRKILHGDLAARNILLADNNVVKICDFGLSKSLHTDENYKKKGHDPLPVKWMAIESLNDGIFSPKTDVWSFGVVLWEFFSLGEAPYPGMGVREVKAKLEKGYRMEKPKFASEYLYNMMMECWDANPSKRPSFAKLVDSLSDLLDACVKTEYMILEAPYVRMNERDYLIVDPEETSDEVQPALE